MSNKFFSSIYYPLAPTLAAALLLALAACGGGEVADNERAVPLASGGDVPPSTVAFAMTAVPAPDPDTVEGTDRLVTAPPASPSAARMTDIDPTDRAAAAAAAANSANNSCAKIRPFYWEIGDQTGSRASGSVKGALGTRAIGAKTVLPLASASKWLYAAYVVQRQAGELGADDVQLLTMLGGFASLRDCRSDQTVAECMAWNGNDKHTPSLDGRFFYNGGHMQQHANLNGLGGLDAVGLAAEIRSQLGAELELTYLQALAPGGAAASATTYAAFLRKVMSGRLRIGALLGSSPACASPATCKVGEAVFSPAPADETMHYSLGHWVEDDPILGDGSFSSPGTFGFYPWIDAQRKIYGIISRKGPEGSGTASMYCWRSIRKAWQTGMTQYP